MLLLWQSTKRRFSGGSGSWDYALLGYRRTEEDIRRDRERFGVLPEVATVIEEVARQQVKNLHLDEQQRLEQLERELQLQDIEWQAQHLELLNAIREQLIDAEIAERLHSLQDDDDARIILSLLAASL